MTQSAVPSPLKTKIACEYDIHRFPLVYEIRPLLLPTKIIANNCANIWR